LQIFTNLSIENEVFSGPDPRNFLKSKSELVFAQIVTPLMKPDLTRAESTIQRESFILRNLPRNPRWQTKHLLLEAEKSSRTVRGAAVGMHKAS
jgi:hypothetical protein